MSGPNLNLLVTLDALLSEGSVSGAAARLGLSPSAMSRALQRLRDATGDPLLVRSGRGLVATPRALEMREEVRRLVQDCETLLRPQTDIALCSVERDFTLRASDAFVENNGPELVARLHAEAPGIRLRFVLKQAAHDRALREGRVDLDIAVISAATDPELRSQALIRDRFVGAMRSGHPAASAPMTPESYAACGHVDIARHTPSADRPDTPTERALGKLGLRRRVAVVVDSFASALAIARSTDLIATVPGRGTAKIRTALHSFELPFESPVARLSLLWHPRFDADPVHRWLRQHVRETCIGLDGGQMRAPHG